MPLLRYLDRSPAGVEADAVGSASLGGAFRVDLDLIERVLKRHPAVSDAAVVVREDAVGGRSMVAYVSAALVPSAVELRAHCRGRLPGYMVPEEFVTLVRVPRTRSGGLDVAALPRPRVAVTDATTLMPPTRLESQLKRIWEEVLDVPSVGLRDDFFRLGGHSLLALRLFARVEKVLGCRLPLSVLFKAPTIEQLAGIISERRAPGTGATLVEVQPGGSRPPIFWLHTLGGGGGAGLLTYQGLARHLGPDQPSYGFVAPADPLPDLEAMAAHYVREMQAVQPAGPYHLGGYCFGGVVAFEMARQLHACGHRVAHLLLIESTPPNPPDRPGLLSAEFLQHFARTTPGWLAASLRRPDELTRRLWRRGRLLKRQLERDIAPPPDGDEPETTLADMIDLDNYPLGFRRHAEAHWRALNRYHPQFFNGRVTLLQTRRPTLLTAGPAHDWRRLASELKVILLPGTHQNILAEPYVKTLAAALTRVLRPCADSASFP